MKNLIDGLEAAGLNPIVIDENFDFSKLNGMLDPRPKFTIDWALLRKQKGWLYGFANEGEDVEYADGLLALLDYIQDNAIDTGQATEHEVLGTEENPERDE